MNRVLSHFGRGASGTDAVVKVATIILGLVLLAVPALFADTQPSGTIAGTLVDTQTGNPLPGVTVRVQGTMLGAVSDVDGKFTIKRVPLGTYTVVVSAIGYNPVTITDVIVAEDKTNRLDVTLSEQTVELENRITVTAKQMKRSEASLLKDRQKSVSVSDAISAEQITKSGAGDAADAMTKVTGASVVGGKFVYVRGLGDRYTNTNINGSPLPSPDPDNQSVPLDMVPSGLLDNIVVQKTFTPDKPGNFTGGSVDLVTRDFPEYRQLTFSSSLGYNSSITGSSAMLTSPSGSKDWLGYDDGKRALPDEIQDYPPIDVPSGRSFINGLPTPDTLALIDYMDKSAKSFDPQMQPIRREAPFDQKYSLSYGDQYQLFDRPLGVIATLSYSRSYKGYNDGVNRRLRLPSYEGTSLTEDWNMTEQKGSEEVLWGGLANLNFTPHPNHKLGVKYTYNQSGINEAELMYGQAREITNQDTSIVFRTRLMEYTERNLRALQFNGDHVLPFLHGSRVDWNTSFSRTTQQNPDRRQFADEQVPNLVEDPQSGDLYVDGYLYAINRSRYTVPTRFWRDLSEDNDSYGLNFTLPYTRASRVKLGASYLKKYRESFEEQYQYSRVTPYQTYNGDIDAFFAEMGVDTVRITNATTGRSQWIFDNYMYQLATPGNNYRGTQKVFAYYAMIEHQLLRNLRLVGGARVEQTDMSTETGYNPLLAILDGSEKTTAVIDETDVLPSVNLIYALTSDINIRATYGKTLARPSLLEMTPVIYESVTGGRQMYGNPDLERTLIDNYDLRWEWFMRPGEILAVSGYYKYFQNPIEQIIFDVNGNIKYSNVPDAKVWGLELEFRRRLDHVSPSLRFISLGGNLTLVRSEIALTESELQDVRLVDPNAKDTRPMQGQSPYIVNLDLGYDNPESGTTITMYYNVFGERLSFNSEDFTPDIYEQPRNQFDLICGQRLFANATLKFSVKNVFDETVEYTQEFKGEKFVAESYKPGRAVSLGISYAL